MTRRQRFLVPLLAISSLAALLPGPAAAWQPATPAFERIWTRTEGPIVAGDVQRTWTWGPQAVSGIIYEEYADSPGGQRVVQYFDKSRMEISNPNGDASSPWYVTNGLLVAELATGRMQTGASRFEQRQPAEIPVAGDADGGGPTYATLGELLKMPAASVGDLLTLRLSADGSLEQDPALAGLNVTAEFYAPETGHTVAEPFWQFLTSQQPVDVDGALVNEQMFPYPFYATGLPLTEAYWVRTPIGGTQTDILVQAFERRVLTYAPNNPVAWQVESGNVGRHYYAWRYGIAPEENVTITTVPTGPETLEYFAKGDPRPDELDWGPGAISVAPDGTFWLADSVAGRVVQFDLDGRKANEISLVNQGAGSIWDVDATTGVIWISWSNHVLGIYKLQAHTPDGALLHDYDLPESLWQDPRYEGSGITVNEAGQVIMEMSLGLRYVQVIGSTGQLAVQSLDAVPFYGHSYRLEATDVWTRLNVVVDGLAIPIEANPGAFALVVRLLPSSDDTFFVTRYSVYDDGSFDWAIEHRALDGRLLGTAHVPEDERYIYVEFDLAVGPDGNLYKLMAYREQLDVLRLGFASP